MLLEAVNFAPASRGGPGGVSKADRAGFAVGSKKFRGAAGQPGAHPPHAWGCPASGAAWGSGGLQDLRQAGHAGPTERRMLRR